MNYLFAGSAIVERLKQTVPEFKAVLKAGNLANISRDAQRSPCAYVIYHGDVINTKPEAHGGVGKAQYVTQQWIVAVVVNLADKRSLYADADELAGELITKTLRSLSGFKINERTLPITRAARNLNAEYIDGWGYYPFIFSVEFIMPRSME